MRRLVIAIFLLVSMWSVCGKAAEALTDVQIARLESLCRIWGTVKFFHPWIVVPPDGKPIDWDAALIEAIPLVEKASSAKEFCDALNRLFAPLNDPATTAVVRTARPPNTNRRTFEPMLPETKFLETGGKKVLLVTATNWPRLSADPIKSSGGLFSKAFDEAEKADWIVLDLRRQNSPRDATGPSTQLIENALRADIASLLKSDLPLNSLRSRLHSGYAPDQGSATSGGYYSGLHTREPRMLPAKPGLSAGKPLVVLTNNGSELINTTLLPALQSSGQAIVIHNSADYPATSPDALYETSATNEAYVRILWADTFTVDGTVGFVPDLIADTKGDGATDAPFETALAVIRGEKVPPKRQSRPLPNAPLPRKENLYPEMTSPSREYRLLGLFRVWNVMHYFFPYQQHMDRPWDSVLTEFIPRFAEAETASDYVDSVREFVAHLQDSHVIASGGSRFSGTLGPSSPLVLLRPVRGELMVAAVDDGFKEKLQAGDTLLEVDGEGVEARVDRLKKYFAASTSQSLLRRVASYILNGPPETAAVVKLRDPQGLVREETVPRPPIAGNADRWRALYESSRRKTAVFSVLGEGYGYFDLARLTVQQVNEAFEAVKETPALIMDMRGYPQGTAWSICSRLTETPMTMANIRRPFWTNPWPYKSWVFDQKIQPSPLWKYAKPVVVLINDDAASQSEHSCLGFEEAAKGRITFVGTPTAGFNGDVTRTSMPGGIRITFSGQDIRHADGRQLQRIGIQPDIRVEPTIAGIVAGQDEVLEAAIQFLNESQVKK